eukprot:5311393-Pleurochrysis_carterae.AAC.3
MLWGAPAPTVSLAAAVHERSRLVSSSSLATPLRPWPSGERVVAKLKTQHSCFQAPPSPTHGLRP